MMKTCCTCKTLVILSILVVAAAVAGITIWRVAPHLFGIEDSDSITEGGSIPDGSPTPAPTAGYQFFQCSSPNAADCCNGLETICDLQFNKVLFPVVHNAHATEENGFPNIPGVGGPNHLFSLEKALVEGYRGLSLDVCNCGGQLQLCHGVCDIGARDAKEVFEAIASFLNNNPTEVLMLIFQLKNDAFGGGQVVDLSDLDAIFGSSAGFSDLIYVHDPLNADWPTLRTLKNNNQRIVMFHHDGPKCRNNNNDACPAGLHYWFDVAAETEFDFKTKGELLDTSSSCQVTRGDGSSQEFFGVNHFVTPPSEDVAEQVNTRDVIEDRMDACADLNGFSMVNAFYIDFWGLGDMLEVTQNYNTARARRARRRKLLR